MGEIILTAAGIWFVWSMFSDDVSIILCLVAAWFITSADMDLDLDMDLAPTRAEVSQDYTGDRDTKVDSEDTHFRAEKAGD